MPDSNTDMVFSPNDSKALGSSIMKPGAADSSGTAAVGKGLGGLSTIKSTTAFGDGVSGVDLGGIGRVGLIGPDPLDMVPAITAGRQDNEIVVFLLDVSNSMEGNYNRGVYNREWFKKLRRAKRSITSSLYKLREEEDKFFLVAFSSGFRLFHEEPVMANDANLTKAVKFIQELRPTSHRERTNLFNALVTALKVKPTRIILVSDGLPTEGVVSIRNILKGVKQKAKGTRIYTFATNLEGSEEAQVLLSKLARDNSGRFVNDRMGLPRGIAVNSDGYIYVADRTVNVFDSEHNRIRSFGSHTIKLAIDNSNDIHVLFFPSVRSSGFGAVGVSRADGTQLKSFAAHGYLPRQLHEPWDIAADSKGNTYVVSTRSNKITVFDKDGNFLHSFGSAGMKAYKTGPHERGDSLTGGSRGGGIDRRGVNSSEPGYFSRPMGIALDSHDNIYVLDSGNRRIQIFDPQMQFMGSFKTDGYGIAIDVDADGNYIYVLLGSGSTGGEELHIYRPDGALVEKFDVGSGTADIDADSAGNIYTLNFVYDEVNVFSSKGERLRSFSTLQ
jgi:sugar lactone lactonase YvrE